MKYSIEKETLTDIANAIRSGKGTTKEEMPLKPTEFDSEITAFLNNFRGIVERSATHIEIPSGITQIGNRAFFENTTIEGVTIPDGVKSIGFSAFNSCSKIKEFKFPPSLESLGESSFAWCGALVYDFSGSLNIPILSNKNAFNGINANAKILVPSDKWWGWSTAPNWTEYASHIVAVKTFYVCGQDVKIIEGQTWQEWIDSKWNTVGATNHDGVVYVNEKPLYIIGAGYTESYVDSSLILVTDMVQDMAYNNSSTYAAFKLCGKWTFGLAGQTLEQWIASPFNNLGAYIQEDDGQYRVYLSDGTYGSWYNTREEIAGIELTDGLVIEEATK